jgi:hypothetical protein
MSGTVAFLAGYPIGMSKNARSFCGLFKILSKKFMGLGVCVKHTKPAWCMAAISNPHAMPTDSCT